MGRLCLGALIAFPFFLHFELFCCSSSSFAYWCYGFI
jgi:hypothetical protein